MVAAWMILTIASVLFPVKEVNAHVCAGGYMYWKANKYLGYEYRMICWTGLISVDVAQKQCQHEGGQLASIHSRYENDFVTSMFYEVDVTVKTFR
ncbi:hypothetical protein ANCDUO_17758 [Ancylostoma duodenale]|uniref:C-type lectin domain-containing protein n=1 Tax=Ancylostoma duodenale TaxID=51022 RepID=A0A0C2CQR7_9BILA|nr:hypothetical protein ANCDUO_17758 [Ancylostoma duodenale]